MSAEEGISFSSLSPGYSISSFSPLVALPLVLRLPLYKADPFPPFSFQSRYDLVLSSNFMARRTPQQMISGLDRILDACARHGHGQGVFKTNGDLKDGRWCSVR